MELHYYGRKGAPHILALLEPSDHNACTVRLWQIVAWNDMACRVPYALNEVDQAIAQPSDCVNYPPQASAWIKGDGCAHWDLWADLSDKPGARWHICGTDDLPAISALFAAGFDMARRYVETRNGGALPAYLENCWEPIQWPAGWGYVGPASQ